jgi:hypothetical protein
MHRLNMAQDSTGAHRPARRWPAALAIAALSFGLVGCGGGGGATSGTASDLGVVKVTVQDSFGAAVPLATVQPPSGVTSTDAKGESLVLLAAPDAFATVTVSREGFVAQSVDVQSTSGRVNEVTVTLERIRSAAGGSLSSRSGNPPMVSGNAQQLSFEVELVVVDADSRPIQGLSASSFTLRPCTPDAANDRNDCMRAAVTGADVAYAAVTPAAESLQLVAAGVINPYAAGLLLDQSGSIAQSDPTGARLFSAKAFLTSLGADDLALAAAFASGPGASIPTPPLTVYAPFKDLAAAPSLFPVLDSLMSRVGGNTPLYEAIDALRVQVVSDASLPSGIAKGLVIFTDGADTTCGSPDACRASREATINAANAQQVRLFTIGLSRNADIAALGELANRTGAALLYADSAEQLLPLYGTVGRLLSLGLPTYRLKWTVQAGTPGAFQPGSTLLGRVQVNTSTGSFEVPFVVDIP